MTPADFQAVVFGSMKLPSEALPLVPDGRGWERFPLIQAGNKPPPGYDRALGWAVVSPVRSAEIPPNVAFVVERLYTRARYDKAGFSGGQSTDLAGWNGAMYDPTFVGDAHHACEMKGAGAQGIQVAPEPDFLFHCWAHADAFLTRPDDIGGVLVTMNVRLVLIDPNGPDNRPLARLAACVGFDWWNFTTGQNAGGAIGQWKWVRPEIGMVSVNTYPPDVWAAHPPAL